jgi:hypothetical protein
MPLKLTGKIFAVAFFAAATLSTARAAQTDVGLSGYGSLNGTTNTSSGLTQIPANSIGGMLELRHISSPFLGFEATYSYNRANQEYSNPVSCPGASCPLTPYASSVSAIANEITGDWIFSLKLKKRKKIHPFALLGAGIILITPTKGTVYSYSLGTNPAFQSAPAPTNSANMPVFVYGIGVDWDVLRHLGLRMQFRGNMYTAPALTTSIGSTNLATQTYEPMIGAYYRF